MQSAHNVLSHPPPAPLEKCMSCTPAAFRAQVKEGFKELSGKHEIPRRQCYVPAQTKIPFLFSAGPAQEKDALFLEPSSVQERPVSVAYSWGPREILLELCFLHEESGLGTRTADGLFAGSALCRWHRPSPPDMAQLLLASEGVFWAPCDHGLHTPVPRSAGWQCAGRHCVVVPCL